MYLRSDYYTNDERWEVTGRRGFARVNRCTGRGLQQPSFEVYVDGECVPNTRSTMTGRVAFRDSGRIGCAGCAPEGDRCYGTRPRRSRYYERRFRYESSALGGLGVDPRLINEE